MVQDYHNLYNYISVTIYQDSAGRIHLAHLPNHHSYHTVLLGAQTDNIYVGMAAAFSRHASSRDIYNGFLPKIINKIFLADKDTLNRMVNLALYDREYQDIFQECEQTLSTLVIMFEDLRAQADYEFNFNSRTLDKLEPLGRKNNEAMRKLFQWYEDKLQHICLRV